MPCFEVMLEVIIEVKIALEADDMHAAEIEAEERANDGVGLREGTIVGVETVDARPCP